MTPDEFLEEFRRSQLPDALQVDNYPLYLMLRKPTNLDYVVCGLLDKKDRRALENPTIFRRARHLDKPHVSDNFRYEMWGTASGIEGRFERDCQLLVNKSDTRGHVGTEATGKIGWGRYTGKQFLLNMEVSADVAKNIILRRVLAPRVEQGYEDEEKAANATWMRLTLTIFNAHKRSGRSDVWFSIGDAYCSSIFSPFQFT